jgi:hypothetical protein
MKRLSTFLAIALLTVSMFAQSPQLMSYQAVVRNSSNALVTNQAVGMRISILQGSATGTAVYVETQTPTTNANGLASLQIGGGTAVTGTFSAINWAAGPYYIKTETDPTGGSNYTITGTNQMLSVPYALYAASAGNLIPPKVVNQGATNIDGITATLNGKINANGLMTQVVFEYGTTTAYGQTSSVQTVTGSIDSLVSLNISGLLENTTYHYRLTATNAINAIHSNDMTFTTPTQNLPILNTLPFPVDVNLGIQGIYGNKALTGGGKIIRIGSSLITAQGLCWGTSPSPTTANSITTTFTDTLKNLTPNTTYYVRAYATNAAGTGYGNEISFNSGQVFGSTYAGGIVFYNDGTGHGLVCAPTDQSTGSVQWYNGTNAITGATGIAIGTGMNNTHTIVGLQGVGNYAAKICYDLVLNGYSDWYLPAIGELALMGKLQDMKLYSFISTLNPQYHYWSSTEMSSTQAHVGLLSKYVPNSYYGNKNDVTNFFVRAIRAF